MDDLGVDVPSDALGPLQDVHWSMGKYGCDITVTTITVTITITAATIFNSTTATISIITYISAFTTVSSATIVYATHTTINEDL